MTLPEKVLIPLIFAVMTFLPAVASATPLHDASAEGDAEEDAIFLERQEESEVRGGASQGI